MIQLTPIAIAATSQQYLTNVVENLCQAFCADNGVQPTGIVNFTVAEQQTVNTQTIVTINAAVLVAYTPKGSTREDETPSRTGDISFAMLHIGLTHPVDFIFDSMLERKGNRLKLLPSNSWIAGCAHLLSTAASFCALEYITLTRYSNIRYHTPFFEEQQAHSTQPVLQSVVSYS